MLLQHNGSLVWAGSVDGVSLSGHWFWFFSRGFVPAGKPPWNGICKLACGTAFGFRGLGLTFSIITLNSECITGKLIYPGGGKCRDKLIAYTSVFAAVTGRIRICHAIPKEGLRSNFESLHMAFMNQFCIFFQNKTVNCHMQAASGQAG